MATRKAKAPESYDSGGNFLEADGTYHFIVTSVEDPATDKDGNVQTGFRTNMQVLHGTTQDKDGDCTEKGKTFNPIFWDQDLTKQDEGIHDLKRQCAFYEATGLIHPRDRGKDIEVDPEKARARQLIATVEKNKKGYMQIRFTDIWHVDDPRAARFPKDAKALDKIPSKLRLKPEDFKQEDSNGSQGGEQQPAGATSADDDLGDI